MNKYLTSFLDTVLEAKKCPITKSSGTFKRPRFKLKGKTGKIEKIHENAQEDINLVNHLKSTITRLLVMLKNGIFSGILEIEIDSEVNDIKDINRIYQFIRQGDIESAREVFDTLNTEVKEEIFLEATTTVKDTLKRVFKQTI
jgi:hypothetical protein